MSGCHSKEPSSKPASPCCGSSPPGSKLSNRLKLTLLAFVVFYLLSYLPFLAPVHEAFLEYFKLVWWAVLLGLLIGGLIDYFVPDEFIYQFLGQHRFLSIPYAVLAGFLLSACSHGILAISIQLYKKGASVPSVIAFLLAAPWANLPVTILLFGFFGWKALWIIAGAMLIALTTGTIFMWLSKFGYIESSREVSTDGSYEWTRIKNFNLSNSISGVWAGTISLSNMVLWWILVGFLAAVLISAYVPHHLFSEYFGADLPGMFLTLIAATIIEVCSEGSAPIAFEIYNQLNVIGNPFIFLMAGVVTDYTEIGLLWSNIGRRTALMLPLVAVPQVLLAAYLMNQYL